LEAITRLVTDSLARHGLDRPVDPRRLQWSRWFRCDSPHGLLVVPSKPGIFAIAEEITAVGATINREGYHFSRADTAAGRTAAFAAGVNDAPGAADPSRRMLAVLRFSEDDDMAFTLDRMFTCENPMRARLASGRCFLRFVVIEDATQRRSICAALNQWMLSSAGKASGLPPDFSSSLEMATESVERALLPAAAGRVKTLDGSSSSRLDLGANKNLHCPQPLPSGF